LTIPRFFTTSIEASGNFDYWHKKWHNENLGVFQPEIATFEAPFPAALKLKRNKAASHYLGCHPSKLEPKACQRSNAAQGRRFKRAFKLKQAAII
jgi:hypothetical protein